MGRGAWWAAVHGVAKSQTQLSGFTFTFHFHALEKEMAAHSSVLAWRIPGTAEPGGLPSMGSHRVGHDWSDLAAAAAVAKLCLTLCNPMDCSLHGSSVHAIVQVRNWSGLPFPSPGDFPNSGIDSYDLSPLLYGRNQHTVKQLPSNFKKESHRHGSKWSHRASLAVQLGN